MQIAILFNIFQFFKDIRFAIKKCSDVTIAEIG